MIKIKEALKPFLNPLGIFNIVLLIIIIVSGAILFMVLVGMIQISNPDEKLMWIEVNSQILNACFTITALMTQPIRFQLFVWTVKWWRSHQTEYFATLISKNVDFIYLSPLKPGKVTVDASTRLDETIASPSTPIASNESSPISSKESLNSALNAPTSTWRWILILFCLNGQCIFQYPITVVQWMYIGRPLERPQWVIPLFLPLSFLCGAIGGLWPMLLGRKRKLLENKAKELELK